MSELQPSFICFDAAAPFGYLLAEHMQIPAVQLGEDRRRTSQTPLATSWACLGEPSVKGAQCQPCQCPWQTGRKKAEPASVALVRHACRGFCQAGSKCQASLKRQVSVALMLGRRSEPGRQVLDATSAVLAEKYGLKFNHNYAYTCGSVAFLLPSLGQSLISRRYLGGC